MVKVNVSIVDEGVRNSLDEATPNVLTVKTLVVVPTVKSEFARFVVVPMTRPPVLEPRVRSAVLEV